MPLSIINRIQIRGIQCEKYETILKMSTLRIFILDNICIALKNKSENKLINFTKKLFASLIVRSFAAKIALAIT